MGDRAYVTISLSICRLKFDDRRRKNGTNYSR